MKKIIVFVMMALLLIVGVVYFYSKINGKAGGGVIAAPDKIIVYFIGGKKELIAKDKEFKTIVKLTNSRINRDELLIVKTERDFNNEYVESMKKIGIALEFVYDNKQEISIKNSDKTATEKYYRIFFRISSGPISYVSKYEDNIFHLGDRDKYNVFSVGLLEKSGELNALVYDMFKYK